MPEQLQLFKKRTKKPMGKDCGCSDHGEGDSWSAQVAGAFAAAEIEADLSPDPRGNTVRRWSGLIAPYETPTGDGRRFAKGALSSRELPIPVKWQRTDQQGHTTSVVVGRIDGIDYEDDGVNAWGIIFDPDPEKLPRLAEDAGEAWELLGQKVIGPSVDLDDMVWHAMGNQAEMAADAKQEIEVTSGRTSAITLVPIPAFAEARPFALDDLDADEYAEMTAITAAGVRRDLAGLNVAADHEWRPDEWALFSATEFDNAGALYAGGEDDLGLFPVAQVIGGELMLIPAAVADAVSVLAYHDAEVQLGEGTKQALRQELEALTAACGLPSPPWQRAALVAAAGWSAPSAPPVALFADPKFKGPTPITIERAGEHLRYSGHVATWGVCHIGFPGQCVTAPHSRTGYEHFHVGSVDTADKGRIRAGKITIGGGHADVRLGFQAALSHYDDASSTMVDVRAGEDDHGIWVSGVVRPGVDPVKLAELASAPLSGDWRHVGGGLEMVAALAVNTPGFGVVQKAERGGEAYALIAAGMLANPVEPEAPSVQALVQQEFARYRRGKKAAAMFASEAAQYGRERAKAAAQVFG